MSKSYCKENVNLISNIEFLSLCFLSTLSLSLFFVQLVFSL